MLIQLGEPYIQNYLKDVTLWGKYGMKQQSKFGPMGTFGHLRSNFDFQ
jgi:hypothetical protein